MSGPGGQLSGLGSGRRGWAERGKGVLHHHHGGKRAPKVQGRGLGANYHFRPGFPRNASLPQTLPPGLASGSFIISGRSGGLIPVDAASSNTHTSPAVRVYGHRVPGSPRRSQEGPWPPGTSGEISPPEAQCSWRGTQSLQAERQELCYAPLRGPDQDYLKGTPGAGSQLMCLQSVGVSTGHH